MQQTWKLLESPVSKRNKTKIKNTQQKGKKPTTKPQKNPTSIASPPPPLICLILKSIEKEDGCLAQQCLHMLTELSSCLCSVGFR